MRSQHNHRHLNSAKADEINQMMVLVAAELASPYAKYPLIASNGGESKMWVAPEGKTAKGEPCFIQGPGKYQPSMKDDYIYGSGPLGFGWYHLLTRDSYHALHRRLLSSAPVPCCAFSKAARQELSDHEDVSAIVYNRSVASAPDDEQGAKDAINIAKGTAQKAYNWTQNEQLVVGAVSTGVTLASN